MSTAYPGTRGRWVRQGSRILLFPAAPARPGWGEAEVGGQLLFETPDKLRIVIFYGFSGAKSDGIVERGSGHRPARYPPPAREPMARVGC